jgi:AcrR family transcriptional regulator
MAAASTKNQRRSNPARSREQVLEAFSEHAKRKGIRAVMMGELARELRMSATTLYKLFPSKEALALACVECWAHELGASEAAGSASSVRGDPLERFTHWLDAWADVQAEISPAFIRDLRTDHPEAWTRFNEVIREQQQRGVAMLRPGLKSEIDERVAFAILKLLMDQVMRPEFANRLRISRHEAIRSAVSIWASGAIDRRGRVRAIDGTRPTTRAAETKNKTRTRRDGRETGR